MTSGVHREDTVVLEPRQGLKEWVTPSGPSGGLSIGESGPGRRTERCSRKEWHPFGRLGPGVKRSRREPVR